MSAVGIDCRPPAEGGQGLAVLDIAITTRRQLDAIHGVLQRFEGLFAEVRTPEEALAALKVAAGRLRGYDAHEADAELRLVAGALDEIADRLEALVRDESGQAAWNLSGQAQALEQLGLREVA